MLSDIEIAKQAKMKKIYDITAVAENALPFAA